MVFGVLDSAGNLLYANAAMRELLGGEKPQQPRADYLINPDFATLMKLPEADPPVFTGLLTAGDKYTVSRTVKAKVYRHSNRVLVLGEYDVAELDRLNRELMGINQKANNLQRQLIKKNRVLEDTLAELRRTQAMLIHSEKMNALGQLVAGIAHEINNPIAFVTGNMDSLKSLLADFQGAYLELETLIQTIDKPELIARVDEIREGHDIGFILQELDDLLAGSSEGLRRICKIINDLRTFSRLQEAELKQIDLAENIQSTLSLAQAKLKTGNIQVKLDLGNLPPLECYPSELNQVFMNLIINAAQAMEKHGGLLTISGCVQQDGTVRIEFQDTGIGIPEDVLPHIFEPFFTTKPVGSGTGLGLSIAHEIISQRHQGRISVDSVVNEGTRFTLLIPQKQPNS